MGGEQSGARVQVNKKSAHKEELLDFVEARPRGVELAGLRAKDALDGARRRAAHVAPWRRGRSAEHGGQASERKEAIAAITLRQQVSMTPAQDPKQGETIKKIQKYKKY